MFAKAYVIVKDGKVESVYCNYADVDLQVIDVSKEDEMTSKAKFELELIRKLDRIYATE